MPQQKFHDSRYDFYVLSKSIPSTRTNVKHTRELTLDPAKPSSFTFADRDRECVEFSRATQQYRDSGFLFKNINNYMYHYRYDEPKPGPYYLETLDAFRRDSGSPMARHFDPPPLLQAYPTISQFPIFRLPQYCVDQILSNLSGPDFAALAFIDKDCRQLARTRQFRSIWIDFSSASLALLRKLVDEVCDRTMNHGLGPKWTLGACIRRITVACAGAVKDPTHKSSWVEALRRGHEAVECHQSHMNALELAIKYALPNLDFLDWLDRVPMSPVFTAALLSSRLTRLELHCIVLSEDFDPFGDATALDSIDSHRLRLRRLVLSVGGFSESTSCALFTKSILKLAAPTLEELVWDDSMNSMRKSSFGPKHIMFGRLRKLHLIGIRPEDDVVLSSFFPASNEKVKVTHLWLQGPETMLGPFFAKRGYIPSLTHLNWIDFAYRPDVDSCLSFIAANPQLQYFRCEDIMPKLSDYRLIPMFSSNFNNLTSLALARDAVTVPPRSLRLIAKIATLRYLWLSAGLECGEKLGWMVDHDCLRKELRPLTQIVWFILTRDAYPNGNQDFTPPRHAKSQQWEDSHRKLMMTQAMEFARGHPKLEWVHFGQIPMAINRVAGEAEDVIQAVPLTKIRKDCWRLLEEMWGRYREDWVY